MRLRLYFWCLLGISFAAGPALAVECTASSGVNKVALLELYTSEGCSSCPPADRWLSSITASGFSADKVVPLAFHVDYWDYIGWRDRYAKPEFSARQREIAKNSRTGFVYTPQATISGHDFRNWTNSQAFAEEITAINHSPAQANIRLTLNRDADNLAISVWAQAKRQEHAVLYIALYENGLSTDVKAGENNGAQLHHDYVVRAWLGPFAVNAAQQTPWQQKLTLPAAWRTASMGAAAFVQSRDTGEVLQALALKMCGA